MSTQNTLYRKLSKYDAVPEDQREHYHYFITETMLDKFQSFVSTPELLEQFLKAAYISHAPLDDDPDNTAIVDKIPNGYLTAAVVMSFSDPDEVNICTQPIIITPDGAYEFVNDEPDAFIVMNEF